MPLLRSLRWALLWSLLILVLCLVPGKDLPKLDWADLLSLDKLVHAALFAVLVVLGGRGLRQYRPGLALRSWPVLLLTLIAIGYGAALEWMQGTLLTDRLADPFDALANAVGALLGLVMLAWATGRPAVA